MFYYETNRFYLDFKGENLLSVHAARILDLSLDIMLSPPIWGTKHFYNQLYNLFLYAGTGIIFLFFRSQIHRCFEDVLAGCKLRDLQCQVQVSDWI